MHILWTKGYEGQEAKVARIKEVKSYGTAFEELRTLLENEFKEESVPDYDTASWSHKQADVNGANRMLRRIIKLLEV